MSMDATTGAAAGGGVPWVNPWRGIVELWQHHPRWAGRFIVGMFVSLTIFMAVTIATTPPRVENGLHLAGLGDIDVNREFGRRFLAGEWLYDGGVCFSYLPISALYWAPMALVPPAVAWAGRYIIALWCTWFIFRALGKMVGRQPSVRPWDQYTCIALTFLLGLHFVLRDLTDGGANLIYLAMMVGGVYCAWLGRRKLSATWLGLAIALKLTPGLFLPFLLWKRQWRLAAYTLAATGLWIALPAAWMGPQKWWAAQQYWGQETMNVVRDKFTPYRTQQELVVNNQSLRLMVMRYLVTFPPGHRLRLDDATDVPLLNLPESVAKAVYACLVLAILGGFAWWSRRRYTRADDPRWVVEAAGIIFLALIFSPVIGMRHGVFMVPAMYLLVVHTLGFRRFDRLTWVLLAVYLAIEVLMNRAMLGKPLYMVLLSYRVHMAAFLLLLAIFLRTRPIVSAGNMLAGNMLAGNMPAGSGPATAEPALAGPVMLRGPHFGAKRQDAWRS